MSDGEDGPGWRPRSFPAPAAPSAGLRALYGAGAVLALGAAIMTFGFPGGLREEFAWAISPALSAATLGAFYCAAVALLATSARAPTWAEARLAAAPVMTISLLLLAATLIHWERFEQSNVVFWLWLAAYVLVPPALAGLIWLQLRGPGDDGPGGGPRLPAWARGGLVVHAALLLGFGALLYLFPGTAERLWPWELTALTSRALGAFVLGTGVTAAIVVRFDDLAPLRAPAPAYAILGAAGLAALARFADDADLGSPAAWIYAGFLLTALAGAVAVTALALRAPDPGR